MKITQTIFFWKIFIPCFGLFIKPNPFCTNWFQLFFYFVFKFWYTARINFGTTSYFFIFVYTAQKIKFSIKNLFGKCDHIWSHLQKNSLMENFIFCALVADMNDCLPHCTCLQYADDCAIYQHCRVKVLKTYWKRPFEITKLVYR